MSLHGLLTKLSELQRWIQDSGGSSSPYTSGDVSLPTPKKLKNSPIKKIDDYVHEVSSTRTPSVEIVFFHGLQLDNSTDPHITTWLSRDKSKLWLEWVIEEIPDARILLVSYDASVKQTGDRGTMDMYRTRENLLHSFTGKRANIGQDGHPVVLVGHCIGGLVMKELCVQANSILSLKRVNEQDQRVENFLWNVKGLFFYATPHHGSRLADNYEGKPFVIPKGALFEDVNTLNNQTARRNEEFRKLREKYEWKTFGYVENREITLGNYFRGLIVPEASARSDVDDFYTDDGADHFTVCQPDSKDSSSFQRLSDFVANVVKQDQKRLHTKMSLPAAEHVGLEARVEEISNILQDKQRLGVVGIGGIGKTTLVKAVFDSISGRFDYTCFLREVKKSMGSRGDSEDLQTLIVSKLHRKGRQVEKEFCWSTLKGKKVLIVLDDAETESQVMAMTESDSFSKDSRVIVTARDSRFLIAEDFSIHMVEQLGLDDSIRLFCLHAFKRQLAPMAYEKQVTRFAEKCGGLPLALKIAGKYLCNQSAQAWNGAFDKLRQAKPINGSREDGLWSILRVSYNDLADDEQEMFLDVATCFHGERLKVVQEAWRVCSWGSPIAGWQNLVDRGMVREDDGRKWKDEKKIWMHEVLRDLGRSIACPDHQNVASHTRVFAVRLPTELLNQEKALVKVLRITRDDDNNLPGMPVHELAAMGFLGGLKEVQILWVDDYGLRSPESIGNVFLPGDVFLPRLVYSRMEFRNVVSRNVVSRNCPLLATFLAEFGKFSQLHHLELMHCDNITGLAADYCDILTGLPAEFGNLSQLYHLQLMLCNNLTTLPAEFGKLSQLEHLELSGCWSLKTLPAEFGKLQGLRHFVVHGGGLQELPDSFVQLQALEELEIKDCSRLLISPSCLWNLRHLERLEVRSCEKIFGWNGLLVHSSSNWTITSLGFLTMEELRLIKTVNCKEGGVTVRALSSNDDYIFDVDDYFSREQFGTFDSSCHNGSLATLPERWGQIHALQSLTIWDGGLPELEMLRQCQELKSLVFKGSDVSELYDPVGQLGALEYLKVCECRQLRALPATLGQLRSLKTLIIEECYSLTKLPDALGQLGELRKLSIWHCRLKALPQTLGKLGALSSLSIRCCDYLSFFPESVGQLRALAVFEISFCRRLRALPDTLDDIGALQTMKIDDCPSLAYVPKSVWKLPENVLWIENCPRLKRA